jgi:hypothetical protein
MTKKLIGAIAATAIAGLVASGSVSHPALAKGKDKNGFKCEGGNACKGKSACKGGDNASCKGKNACKGKGVAMTKDEAACTKAKEKNMPKDAAPAGDAAGGAGETK